MLGSVDQPIPVGLDILWRSTHLGNGNRNFFGRYHFDGIPRADLEIVGIGLFAGDVDTNLTADAAFDVDLTPTLQVVELVVLLHLDDAVDWTHFQATFAASAIVGIDDCQFFGQLFTGALLCHKSRNRLKKVENPTFRTIAPPGGSTKPNRGHRPCSMVKNHCFAGRGRHPPAWRPVRPGRLLSPQAARLPILHGADLRPSDEPAPAVTDQRQ